MPSRSDCKHLLYTKDKNPPTRDTTPCILPKTNHLHATPLRGRSQRRQLSRYRGLHRWSAGRAIGGTSLSLSHLRILGQILPGVPVWKLGAESRFPGMAYVVFPGNVGTDESLAEALQQCRGE